MTAWMLALLLLGTAPAQPAARATAQAAAAERFAAAEAAESAGDLEQALAHYTAGLAQREDWNARLARGLLLLRMRRAVEAAADFDIAVNNMPEADPARKYLKSVALTNRGIARSHADLAGADDDYEQSLTLARAVEAGKPEPGILAAVRHQIGRTLTVQGERLQEIGAPHRALQALGEGIGYLRTDDAYWLARAHVAAGRIMVEGPAWAKGLEHLKEAARYAEVDGNPTLTAEIWSAIAHGSRSDAQLREALGRLEAVSFAALPDATYWDGWRAAELSGLMLSRLHDYAAAQRWADRAEQAGIADHPGLRITFLTLRANLALSRHDDARLKTIDAELENSIAALPAASKHSADLRILQVHVAAQRSDFKRALGLARDLQHQLLQVADSPTPLAAFPSRALAFVLYTLADMYHSMGLLPDGLELLRRSISLYQEIGLERETLLATIRYAHFWALIDPHGREDAERKAEWRRTLDALTPKLATFDAEVANAYHMTYAIASLAIDDPDTAERHVKVIDVSRLSRMVALDLSRFTAQLALRRNDLDGAASALANIAPEADTLPPAELAGYYALEGAVAKRRASPAVALTWYRKALDITERLSAQSADLAFASSLRDGDAALYEDAIEAAAALPASQTDRASTIVELVLRAIVPVRPIAPAQDGPEAQNILNRLAIYRHYSAAWPEFQRTHPKADFTEADLRFEFRRDYARYFALLPEASGEPPDSRHERALTFLQARAKAEDRQIRVYFVGRRLGVILTVARGTVRAPTVTTNAVAARLTGAIETWRGAIDSLEEDSPEAVKASSELLTLLFPEGWRNTPPRIEIVPHGVLWELPFETLTVSRATAATLRYLDDERTIAYVTPITLSRAIASDNPLQAVPTRDLGFFFLNPAMSAPDTDPLIADPDTITALRAARIPVTHIFSERRATERALLEPRVQRGAWLHFTTHSARENLFEEQVGLALTADPGIATAKITYTAKPRMLSFDREIDYRGDGFVSPREVSTWRLRARFVFLHGCHTTRARISFSSGPLGLVSAFLVAGAQNVIASHWNVAVREEITQGVIGFYSALAVPNGAAAKPLDQALRDARAAIRAKGAFGRHPYAWAPFSLYQ